VTLPAVYAGHRKLRGSPQGRSDQPPSQLSPRDARLPSRADVPTWYARSTLARVRYSLARDHVVRVAPMAHQIIWSEGASGPGVVGLMQM